MTFADDMQLLEGWLGGLLIGVSALILLLGKGYIAGISGIVGNLISHPRQSAWRGIFILGLLAGTFIYNSVNGSLNIDMPHFDIQIALAAILVGVGTRLGAGCTSGHGVCGIGRRSARSIWATAIFMVVAVLTVMLAGR